MDKKEIDYAAIVDVFEPEGDCPIFALIQEIAGSIYDFEGEIDPDKAFDLTQNQQGVAFALGFVIGSKMFEIDKSEGEVLATVNQITELIRESGLFPYLPIEPKTHLNSYLGNSAPVASSL